MKRNSDLKLFPPAKRSGALLFAWALALGALSQGGFAQNPIPVRIFNNTGTNATNLMVWAAPDGGSISFTYTNTGNSRTTVSAGNSFVLSRIKTARDSRGRTYYPISVVNAVGARIYFAVGTNGVGGTGNPSATGGSRVPWAYNNFDLVELTWDGNAADVWDVSAVNAEGLVPSLALCSAPGTPFAPASANLKGFTNLHAIAAMTNSLARLNPASRWLNGSRLVRFVSPASCQGFDGGLTPPYPGGIVMPANNLTGVNLPGATNQSMAPYLYMVSTSTPIAYGATGYKIFARISNTIAFLPSNFTYAYSFDLTLRANGPAPTANQLNWLRTGSGTPYYYTPTIVLTNGTITQFNSTTTNRYTGLSLTWNPDAGAATNSKTSLYIFQAPPSTWATGTALTGSDPYLNLRPVASWSLMLERDTRVNVNQFGANLIDTIAGDVAFGFAGGFVMSPVQGFSKWGQNGVVYPVAGSAASPNANNPMNPVAGSRQRIGTMYSDSWWFQTNVYAPLQPSSPQLSSSQVAWYSIWGEVVSAASSTAYAHPYGDRMKQNTLQPGLLPYPANTNRSLFVELQLNNALSTTNHTPPPATTPMITSSRIPIYLTNTASGVEWSYRITANNNPLTYSAAPLPRGVTLNPLTGLISGTIPAGQFYNPINIQLSASNANGWGSPSTLRLYVLKPGSRPRPPYNAW